MWIAGWLAAVAFGGLTAYEGWVTCRPPLRAVKYNWPFAYGFAEPKTATTGPYRLVGHHAAIVLDLPRPLMSVTIAANPLALSNGPVDVKIWLDRVQSVKTTLRDSSPVTQDVPVPGGHTRILLEVETSSERDDGVTVTWEFIETPR